MRAVKLASSGMSGLLLAGLFSCALQAQTLVENAWVRAMPPGSPTAAVYLRLVNHDESAHTLVGVASDSAASAELHAHRMADGMARMEELRAIPLATGEVINFEPGGYHIMLINPVDLQEGDKVGLQLRFDNTDEIRVVVPVLRSAPGATATAHPNGHH